MALNLMDARRRVKYVTITAINATTMAAQHSGTRRKRYTCENQRMEGSGTLPHQFQ